MKSVSRKQFLKIVATTSATAAVSTITGCGDDASTSHSERDSGVGQSGGSGPGDAATGGRPGSDIGGGENEPARGGSGGDGTGHGGTGDAGRTRDAGTDQDAGRDAGADSGSGSSGRDSGADSGSGGNDSGMDSGSGGNDSGTDSGSGGNDSGTDSGSGGNDSGTDGGRAEVQTCSTVSISGHPHTVTIPPEDVVAGAAKNYLLTGSGHTHDLAISAAQMVQLQTGESLTLTATRGHTHQVTIQCR